MKILALKIESFRNFATIFKITVISKFVKNVNIGAHTVVYIYVTSQLIFFWGREIAEGGSEILRLAESFGLILSKF